MQAHVVQRFEESINNWPDKWLCPLYEHGLPESVVLLIILHGSSGQRGQHSPEANWSGFSHVNGGHSSFQQSNSPYFEKITKKKIN